MYTLQKAKEQEKAADAALIELRDRKREMEAKVCAQHSIAQHTPHSTAHPSQPLLPLLLHNFASACSC